MYFAVTICCICNSQAMAFVNKSIYALPLGLKVWPRIAQAKKVCRRRFFWPCSRTFRWNWQLAPHPSLIASNGLVAQNFWRRCPAIEKIAHFARCIWATDQNYLKSWSLIAAGADRQHARRHGLPRCARKDEPDSSSRATYFGRSKMQTGHEPGLVVLTVYGEAAGRGDPSLIAIN